MTSHVAVSTPDFVVAFSDSQGTVGNESEVHGGQKLFFGPDFLVAKAGSSLVSNPLFSKLADDVVAGNVDSLNLGDTVKKYLHDEVRPHHWGEVQFLTATPCSEGRWIQEFVPEVFLNFGQRSCFNAIGSGSVFVQRALDRLISLRCPWNNLGLAGTFCVTKRLADAANESLTVDDTHLVGIIHDSKSYAMGDAQIRPWYIDDRVQQHWPSIGNRFDQLSAIAEMANSAIDTAFCTIHGIWSGQVDVQAAAEAINAASEVQGYYDVLQKQLADYFAWYDGLLGR